MELQSQLMLILQEDVQVRAPPVTLPRGVPKVSIFHPGYEKKYPPIFQFPALDDGGISYDVVYYACCIVTGNNWPSGDDEAKIGTDEFDAKAYPYLTKTNDHTAPAVDRPADGVLRGSRYFLYVPGYMDGGNEPYPITGTFRDWVYPHNKLPRPWRDVNIDPATPETMRMMTLMKESSSTTRYRDTSCRMTGGVLATEQSHLIPRAEAAWFNTNDMEAYMLDEFAQPAIDDLANTVLLRVDVHKLLDQKIIVPVPKMQNDLYQLVTNVLQYKQGTYSELVRVYHNRLYRPLEGVSPQYLFARFAWSLFSKETMPIFDVKRGNIAVLVRNETKEGEMVDENNNPILKRMVVSNRAQLGTSVPTSGSKRTRVVEDVDVASESEPDDYAYETRKRRLFTMDWLSHLRQEEKEEEELDKKEEELKQGLERRQEMPPLSQSMSTIVSDELPGYVFSQEVAAVGSKGGELDSHAVPVIIEEWSAKTCR